MSQRKSNPNRYPPSISLRDLAEQLTVPVVRAVVVTLPNLVEAEPKGKELWRYIHTEAVCIVIGYAASVVVSGEDAEVMRVLARDIRQAAQLAPGREHEARMLADMVIAFIDNHIVVNTDTPIDFKELRDLANWWSYFDDVTEALAYRHIASSITDAAVRRSYLRLTKALMGAFDLGMSAAFEYVDEKAGTLDPLPPVVPPETYPFVPRRAVHTA